LKVPFFRLKLGQPELKSVTYTIKSGWITAGPKSRELEQRIAQIAGVKYAAAVSSGTAGLFLALKALSIGDGDEVITTPLTMIATIEAILHCGATPVLVDINPQTLNINPELISKKITKKTRAIISVDMAGWPADYRALKKLVREYKLHLIDDAAHSLGASYRDKPIGSLADATVFSFYSTKNITSGEGGMVVSNSKRIIDKVRQLSLHAMSSSGWKRYSGGSWRYDVTDLGYKFNYSDLAASLALGQLTRFDVMRKKREQLAARYIKKLKPLKEFIELPYTDNKSTHAWHLFIIKLNLSKLKIGRDRFISELENKGVGCGVHFIPVYRFSYYKKLLKHKYSQFPAAENCYGRIISLPFYVDLSYKEVDYVCSVINRLIDKYKI